MKIIIVNNIFLLGSGGENHIIEVSKFWRQNTNEVQILKPKDDSLLRGISLLRGLRLYLTIAIIYASRMFKLPALDLTKRYDCVIAVSHYPQDVLPAVLLHFLNPKSSLVIYNHGILIPPEHGTFIRTASILYNYVGSLLSIPFANLIFTVDKLTRDYLLRFGAKGNQVVITNNGVDFSKVCVANKRSKTYAACYLGRLNKSKGVVDLPCVWAKVERKHKNAKLIIMGGGTEEQGVKETAKQLCLEKDVVIAGSVSEKAKYEKMNDSRIFIYPSYLESWGIVIAEAMACGLPVIAYNLPTYKEVFKDKIITVQTGNIDAMAERVVFLLDNPAIAEKIGSEGREFVRRYDWTTIAQLELQALVNLKQALNKEWTR